MASYLDRYVGGEYEAVWTELCALGEHVRAEPVLSDAQAVAREMMRRVRLNVEMLIQRLASLGYAFAADPANPGDAPVIRGEDESLPIEPPTAASLEALALLEREVGPLPLSLHAFYEVVGAVNLLGVAPLPPGEDAWFDLVEGDPDEEPFDGWHRGTVLDPLMVYGVSKPFSMLGTSSSSRENSNSFIIVLFLDMLLKYGIGGVGSIYTLVPAGTADAALMFEGHPINAPVSIREGVYSFSGGQFDFVAYLRHTILRQGGFAGYVTRGGPELGPPVSEQILATLLENLIPF